MLEIVHVTRRFGDRLVLDDVSFAVPPGQVVGLLGPNGAGKTTAMRIVFGLVDPDDGEVRWAGGPVGSELRRRWGYQTQERGLYPDMAVHEQVVYAGRLHGLRRPQAEARADALLVDLDLEERAQDRVDSLSGGMQQRAQLATVLVHDPPVVVLDEPFAGLDPVAIAHLSRVVTERAERGLTVVFSSHQLELVEELCDSIVMIDRGRIVMQGRVADLKAASPDRHLRVVVDGAPQGWHRGVTGATETSATARGVRLRLDPGVDPVSVLDSAREAGSVRDFALEQPSLGDLFLRAVAAAGGTRRDERGDDDRPEAISA